MSDMMFCQGLYELMDSYDGFIMDQWGVLHNGLTTYDGAIDVLNHLKRRKKQVVILSNSAKRSSDNVERMKKLGIKSGHYRGVVSAGEVTWQGLKEQKNPPFKGIGKKCYLISRHEDKSLLDDLDIELVSDIEQAQFILITSFDSVHTKMEDLEPVLKKAVIMRIPAICANPDIVTIYEHERSIGPGAIAMRYHELGGAAHYIGKPHKVIFRYCLSLFENIIPSRILMIGDSIQHDIVGGVGMDIDTAFITSGIHTKEFTPGMSVEQKRKVMQHLTHNYGGIQPTWVMDGLIWQTPEAALRERDRARMKE